LAALILIAGVPIATQDLFAQPCNLEASPLKSTIQVNNEPSRSFTVQESSPRPLSIGVSPSEVVLISASLDPQPDGCQPRFSIDWVLQFTVFNLLDVKTDSETPNSAQLRITLGELRPGAEGEDPVTIIVRDTTGRLVQSRIIQLKRR
jgi:hypothetical protein